MLHQFWQSLCFSFFLLTLVMGEAWAANVPGLIESLASLRKSHLAESKALEKSATDLNKRELSQFKSLTLHPTYLRELYFFSERNYLELANIHSCQLFALLDNNLLKDAEGQVDSVLVETRDKLGRSDTGRLKLQSFLNYIVPAVCPELARVRSLFSSQGKQNIFNKLVVFTPQTIPQCYETFEKHLKNYDTAYACQQLKTKQSLPETKIKYYKNLCHNLSHPQKFCQFFRTGNFWQKAKERKTAGFTFRCQSFLKRKSLTAVEQKSCQRAFEDQETLCQDLNQNALFPQPNCQELARILPLQRMEAKQEDCPYKNGNHLITTFSRVLNHFNGSARQRDASCHSDSSAQLLNFLEEEDSLRFWQHRVCYDDPFEKKELCHQTLLTNHPVSQYSLDRNLAKIFKRIRKNEIIPRCQFIKKSEYKPLFLKFKRGCFLVYDPLLCLQENCPASLIIDEKEVQSLSFKGNFLMEFFPLDYQSRSESLVYLLEKKLQRKTREIKNVSQLKDFLSRSEKRLVFGAGCKEDLYPELFNINSFNQCTPLFFTIDNFIQDKLKTLVLFRSGFDDIHSPRQISWPVISNAVANYSSLRKLNAWTLYGIK